MSLLNIPLEWLCCPLSGQALREATPAEIAKFEQARASGALRFVKDPVVLQLDLTQPLEAALVREDGAAAYVIEAGIPVLLPDHALIVETQRD